MHLKLPIETLESQREYCHIWYARKKTKSDIHRKSNAPRGVAVGDISRGRTIVLFAYISNGAEENVASREGH